MIHGNIYHEGWIAGAGYFDGGFVSQVRFLSRIRMRVAQLVEQKQKGRSRFLIILHSNTGVIWFRQAGNGAEITGMTPPYGPTKRTDEEEIYGELKAA